MATFERVIAPKATLVDLLDRVLDRGLIIDADIIISLAGVPLIGIKLRAALAGMETMVQYGLMREWDNSIRTQRLAVVLAQPGEPALQAHGQSQSGCL
ncbi:MAG: gas vesicle protein [Dehalococcoidia bacterium]|nr:gas vesicle protein [Dehalococcoidia bacterium]